MTGSPIPARPAGLPAGAGFEWTPTLDRRHRQAAVESAQAIAVFVGCILVAAYVGGFDPLRLAAGIPKTMNFLSELVPPLRSDHLVEDVAEWYWGIWKWFDLLVATLLMALLATTLGTVIGAALSFTASRNLIRDTRVYWLTRRVLEIARTVPDLVWALIFVFAFGLGPLAGVLAITVHTVGGQGKLFAEVNENIDMGPVEGIRAAGGDWFEEIVYGVLPQVLPNYVSYSLWRFEVNVRLATIIGFVGAGGIGMELYESIALNYYTDAGAILLIVFLAVFLIDLASEQLRHRLIGRAA
jgi:phosphonate transport system permease protein